MCLDVYSLVCFHNAPLILFSFYFIVSCSYDEDDHQYDPIGIPLVPQAESKDKSDPVNADDDYTEEDYLYPTDNMRRTESNYLVPVDGNTAVA